MGTYKGVVYYCDSQQVWKAQAGYTIIARCKTVGGVKRAITAFIKREET